MPMLLWASFPPNSLAVLLEGFLLIVLRPLDDKDSLREKLVITTPRECCKGVKRLIVPLSNTYLQPLSLKANFEWKHGLC